MQILFKPTRIRAVSPSVSVRSHIKLTIEGGDALASERRGLIFSYDNTRIAEYSDHRVRSPNTVYSSWHRDCFAVLISKMVNALEAAAKNEGGRESSVAF